MATANDLKVIYDRLYDAVQKSAPNTTERHQLMEDKRAAYIAWRQAADAASRVDASGASHQSRASLAASDVRTQSRPKPAPAPPNLKNAARLAAPAAQVPPAQTPPAAPARLS